MILEGIMLSEIIREKIQILYGLTYMWNLKITDLRGTESRLMVTQGQGSKSWKWGKVAKGYRFPVIR